ncbi:AAA family ATPase [Bacteriovoracaceae bacterium]|nr:AAA family ATPase [Bacteriovoracaceae bacterium]|tara:strand:+ start:90632 stop:91555 length:924 start_codon:yes stop_codon:yes gene_type:complete
MDSLNKQNLNKIIEQASQVLLGKEEHIKLALCCILARGNLLIEDIPGVGKTTLARIFGKLLGLSVSRIQFTNDMLPGDILGINFYDGNKQQFEFRKGPIFGQLILADELNRATPKSQSALLQVMEERKVDIDGLNFKMDPYFTIIATQNPLQQIGTYPLPESQIDRFFMGLEIGLPDEDIEKRILLESYNQEKWKELKPVATLDELGLWMNEVGKIDFSENAADFVLKIIQTCRKTLEYGKLLSPRSSIDLVRASKSYALLNGKTFVTNEEIFKVAPYILGHRAGGVNGVSSGIREVKRVLNELEDF